MFVDRRADGHEAADLFDPRVFDRVGGGLEESEEGHDGALAVGDDVDLGLGVELMGVGEGLVETAEDFVADAGELGDELHVAEVVIEDLLQVEIEDAGFFGEEEEGFHDANGVDRLIEDVLDLAVVDVGAAGLAVFREDADAADDGAAPFLGFLEGVAGGLDLAGEVGPVDFGEAEGAERPGTRGGGLGDDERRRAVLEGVVEPAEGQQGAVAKVVGELRRGGEDGAVPRLVADAMDGEDELVHAWLSHAEK